MKPYLFILLGISGLFFQSACEKGSDSQLSDDSSKTAGVNENADDYKMDTTNAVHIHLNETSVSIDSEGASAVGQIVTITKTGIFIIDGSLTNGQIIVNTEDEETVKIILNNVNVVCSNSAPVFVKKAKKVVINMAANTSNTLTDGNTYVLDADGEPNATIFSKSDLTIFGEGSLTVLANYNDGISSKDGLIIKSGTIGITAKDDGIRGKDYLIIRDGTLTLNTTGDGLKSDNTDGTSWGYILIETGTFNITSTGDAITAQTNVSINAGEFNLTCGGGSNHTISETLSAKGIKAPDSLIINGGTYTINSADDGLHSNGIVSLNTGTYSISSADDGIHAEKSISINEAELSIAKSYEGIESGIIKADNSNISIVASDDGFNASYGNGGEANDNSCLYINSGYVFVNASGGDGLDSNGNIVITGGTIIVHGPASQPEVGMDYNGTCKVSGGTLVISGTSSNMTQSPSTSSSQYSVLIKFSSVKTAKTLVHIEDSNGNEVLTFAPIHSYQSLVLSSPKLINGSTYTIYTGGSSTGSENNGVYAEGVYSGGTSYASFTISSIITTLGTSQPR